SSAPPTVSSLLALLLCGRQLLYVHSFPTRRSSDLMLQFRAAQSSNQNPASVDFNATEIFLPIRCSDKIKDQVDTFILCRFHDFFSKIFIFIVDADISS